MNVKIAILCLAGAAGVWAWALFAPKQAEIEPLPARFVGEFRIFAIAPPPGQEIVTPLPPGKEYIYRFAADGTYSFSVMLNGGFEVTREDGYASIDKDGVLTLRQISRNRQEDRAPPVRWHAEWTSDDKGPFLSLRNEMEGYTFRLCPPDQFSSRH
jgi:hypothetical protein